MLALPDSVTHPILTLDDPWDTTSGAAKLLRLTCSKVPDFAFGTPGLKTQLDQLEAVCVAAGGLGLSGPQIGWTVRLVVARLGGRLWRLVNPTYVHMDARKSFAPEGCLSLPGWEGRGVPRRRKVVVQARDERGHGIIRLTCDGLDARVLQHELDHLDGVLFPDRIPRASVVRVQGRVP